MRGKTNLKSVSNSLARMAINCELAQNRPDATLAHEH